MLAMTNGVTTVLHKAISVTYKIVSVAFRRNISTPEQNDWHFVDVIFFNAI